MFLELLLSLTPLDYTYLAKVIRVEAVRNTFDEYCVAASVLNRVNSKVFPNSVYEVVHAKSSRGQHQYQGFDSKYPKTDWALVKKLNSIEGRKNILKAYSIIGNRTDFKGQSMLRHRVPSEDPMCSSNGNFYHYHWQ